MLFVAALTGCHENYSETVTITYKGYDAPEECEEIPKDYKEVDPSNVHAFKVRYIGRSLGSVFCDLPDKHLSVCYSKGFRPIHSLKSAYEIDKPISKLATCDEYTLDKLTHSLPFLQADAHDVVKTIGKNQPDV